jgi:hypothetical protein
MNSKKWASLTRSSLIRIKSLKLSWRKKARRKTVNLRCCFFYDWIKPEWTLDWPLTYFAKYRDQLMALAIIPGDLDSTAKTFADLKASLDEEKAAWLTARLKLMYWVRQSKTWRFSQTGSPPKSPLLKIRLNTLWTMTTRSRTLSWPRNSRVSPLVTFTTFYHSWIIF